MDCKKRLRGMEKGLKHQNLHLQWDLGHELAPGVSAELSFRYPGLGGWRLHPWCLSAPVPKSSPVSPCLQGCDEHPRPVGDPQCLLPPGISSAGMVGLHLCLQTPWSQGHKGPGSGPFNPKSFILSAGTAVCLGRPLREAPSGARFPSAALALTHPSSLGWGNMWRGVGSFQAEIVKPPSYFVLLFLVPGDRYTHDYC